MKKLILASGSPRRKVLLAKLGIPFIIDPANIDEASFTQPDPNKLVIQLATAKAMAIAPKHPDAIIIGADTVVALNNTILGKPRNKNHAISMLKKLSGKMHQVVTGYTLIDTSTKQKYSKAIASKVYFYKLKLEEIEDYMISDEPMDKAGAYAIQGKGSKFIKKYEGDFDTIVGLPLNHIKKHLNTTPPFPRQLTPKAGIMKRAGCFTKTTTSTP